MTHWQNRIIGEGIEAPDQLLANPANWRIHPKPQQDALTSVLDTVGWVQRVIVNKRTGHIVDGHLRVAWCFTEFVDEGGVIVDPFLGSGISAIAAEQTGHTTYGMELSPDYIAVTLERLSLMGLTPKRVETGGG